MGPLVVQIPVARCPKPVPVVVNVVVVIVVDHRRTFPEFPIQVRRRLAGRLVADTAPRLAAVAVGNLQSGKLAALKGRVQSGDAGIAAALRAVLDDDAIFFLSFDGDTAFGNVVAQRLFNIHMLAGLSSPDGHQGMPMVGRRDGNRIDVLVFQSPPQIFVALAAFAIRSIVHLLLKRPQHVLVRVDQVGDLDVLQLAETLQMLFAAAVEADERNPHAVVRADDRA